MEMLARILGDMLVNIREHDYVPYAFKAVAGDVDLAIFNSLIREKGMGQPQVLAADVDSKYPGVFRNAGGNKVRTLSRTTSDDQHAFHIRGDSSGEEIQLLCDSLIVLNNVLDKSAGKIIVERFDFTHHRKSFQRCLGQRSHSKL